VKQGLERLRLLLFVLGVLGWRRMKRRSEGRRRRRSSWRRGSGGRGRLLHGHAKGAVNAALHGFRLVLMPVCV